MKMNFSANLFRISRIILPNKSKKNFWNLFKLLILTIWLKQIVKNVG